MIDATPNYGDLLLDVAVKAGIATTPTGGGYSLSTAKASELDLLARAFKDAYRFVLAARDWKWMRVPLRLTLTTAGLDAMNVPGDPLSFRLGPEIAGPGDHDGSYLSPTDAYRKGPMRRVSMRLVEETLLATPDVKGPPLIYAMDYTGAGGQRPSLTLKVAPAPDQTYTLTIPVRRQVTKLTDYSERPSWPDFLDDAVKARALYELLASNTNLPLAPRREEVDRDFAASLATAIDRDRKIEGPLIAYLSDATATNTHPASRPVQLRWADGSPLGD